MSSPEEKPSKEEKEESPFALGETGAEFGEEEEVKVCSSPSTVECDQEDEEPKEVPVSKPPVAKKEKDSNSGKKTGRLNKNRLDESDL